VLIFDLKNEAASVDLSVSEDKNQRCEVARHQFTENWAGTSQENGSSSLDDLRIGVSCQDTFKILTGTNNVLFQTKSLNLLKNGGVRSLFRSSMETPFAYIVQFEDMSLHHIASDNDVSTGDALWLQWSREEALSDISQAELIS